MAPRGHSTATQRGTIKRQSTAYEQGSATGLTQRGPFWTKAFPFFGIGVQSTEDSGQHNGTKQSIKALISYNPQWIN